jgi:cytochrome c5
MNKTVLILFLASIITIISQCKTSKSTASAPAPATETTQLAAAQKRWPDATLASLTTGHSLYNKECTSCHGAQPVSQYSEPEWERIISRMAPKAKLTPAQTEHLRRYVLSKLDLSPNK